MSQIKILKSALPQNLWSQNIAGWWLRVRRLSLPSHVIFDHAVQEKSKILYIDFPNIYSHKVWKSGNFVWGEPYLPSYETFYQMVKWQIKNFISALPSHHLSQHLVRQWLWMGELCPPSFVTFWLCGYLTNGKPCICT